MAITISGDAPNFTSASATTITGVTTLNGSSGVLATQNGMTGIAKAWILFDGTTSTPTILGSFNVSSITDNGAGDYTINFTTAMANINYATVATASNTAAGTGIIITTNSNGVGGNYTTAPTTSAVRMLAFARATGTNTDSPYISLAVLGS